MELDFIRYKDSIIKRTENRNGRRLVVVGDDYFSDYIYGDAIKMGIDSLQIRMTQIREMNLSKDDFFFLVAVYTNHKVYYDELISCGYKYNVDFTLMNTGGFCRALNRIDPLLGYSRTDDCGQYTIIGNGEFKIILLGSSTTDIGEAGQISWPYYLFECLKKEGIDSTIYCGAVAGYCSGQELLKLLRDIDVIKPNLVLSFSGINDYKNGTHIPGNPFINKYYYRAWSGISKIKGAIPDSLDMRNIEEVDFCTNNQLSDAEIWASNEKKMNAICESCGALFIGALEPFICFGCKIDKDLFSLIQNCLPAFMSDEYVKGYREFHETIIQKTNSLEWFADCSHMLDGLSNIYIDSMHFNQRGCSIVGSKIAGIVLNRLKKRS